MINIIHICSSVFADVDSSKLDLSKELANDFSNTFDGLIDPHDLQLNADDFVKQTRIYLKFFY